MQGEGEEGVAGEQDNDMDIDVDYGEFEATPEPDAYMESGDGLTDDFDVPNVQVVDPMGVSEGTMEAAAGIYLDDEPASEPIDILPDDGNTDLGEEEAKPKAKKRK
jgi:hypothetical protein